jgi:hypothetical protein
VDLVVAPDGAGAPDPLTAAAACLAGAAGACWWSWRGRAVARVPGRPAVHLADLVGSDACRVLPGGPAGPVLVRRRALLVVSPGAGRGVVDEIEVPWAARPVPVEHAWLDPVVEPLADWAAVLERVPGPAGDGADALELRRERFWHEPFPLSARQWPGSAPGPLLEVAETVAVTATGTGTAWAVVARVEPWWPTFALADTPGQLLVHLTGRRHGAWAELPAVLREAVERSRPEFAHPPAPTTHVDPGASVDHLWDALAATRRRRGARGAR